MFHIYQLKIINLLPDRPIYKKVLPPDTREHYFLTAPCLGSQIHDWVMLKSKTELWTWCFSA